MLQTRLDNFLQGSLAYYPGCKSAADCFAIPGDLPPQFDVMLGRLLTLYEECIEPMASVELLYLAEEQEDMDGLFAAQPMDFRKQNQQNDFIFSTASYYIFHAVTQLNDLLPALREHGIGGVERNDLLKLQQAVERADSASMYDGMLERYRSSVTPEQWKKRSRAGGKARAARLHGATKDFVKRRFEEIRAKGSTLNMSQIAQKLADELWQNPIEGNEPLSNPQDTIYRWVRALNRNS
jgi:hypothetical protein